MFKKITTGVLLICLAAFGLSSVGCVRPGGPNHPVHRGAAPVILLDQPPLHGHGVVSHGPTVVVQPGKVHHPPKPKPAPKFMPMPSPEPAATRQHVRQAPPPDRSAGRPTPAPAFGPRDHKPAVATPATPKRPPEREKDRRTAPGDQRDYKAPPPRPR